MLSSAETVDVIADCLATHGVPSVVLDPVCYLSDEVQLVEFMPDMNEGDAVHQRIAITT